LSKGAKCIPTVKKQFLEGKPIDPSKCSSLYVHCTSATYFVFLKAFELMDKDKVITLTPELRKVLASNQLFEYRWNGDGPTQAKMFLELQLGVFAQATRDIYTSETS